MIRSSEHQLMVISPSLGTELKDEVQKSVDQIATVAQWDVLSFFERIDVAHRHLTNSTKGVVAQYDAEITRDDRRSLDRLFSKARELGIPTGFLSTEVVEGPDELLVRGSTECTEIDLVPTLSDWLERNGEQRPYLRAVG